MRLAAAAAVVALAASTAEAGGSCTCHCPQCAGACLAFSNDCGCGFVPQCTEGDLYGPDTDCGPTCGDGETSTYGECPYPACDICDCVAGDSGDPGDSCNDGNFCTSGDTLDENCACAGAPISCDDGNPCTNDFCFLFGCNHNDSTDGTPCGDGGGDVCGGPEVCMDGDCVPSGGLDCDDGDDCTEDTCDPATGCSNLNACGCDSDDDCRDGSVCNGAEVCTDGECGSGKPADCDDDDDCTIDGCDPKFGCTHTTPVDVVCGCVSVPLFAGDPDSPSSAVVVDGAVSVGVEYPPTPVGYAVLENGVQAGAVHASTYDGGLHFGVVALGVVFIGAAMEVDLDGDDAVDLSVLLGDDLDGDGDADAVMSSDGDGAEFRLPLALATTSACPRVGLGFTIAGHQDPAWWPAGRPGAVQCTCGPPPALAPGSDGGAEGEGMEGEGSDGGAGATAFYGSPDGCCRVSGSADVRPTAWSTLLVALALARVLWRGRRGRRR
ncbi:MAG: hypothetical protein AABZ30_15755 [Myxococcota bacterium]